jgi:DNA-binding LacI/PurR family transcriptional regulator
LRTAKPTIYTVAELAGVSISTVSRILNKTYRGTEAIRKRVENAIRKTNFQPSPVARRLTGKAVSSQMIGIMAPFFINPFFVEVLKGIYKVIHSAGYHAMLYDVDSKIIKKSTLKRIQDDGFLDGVLLVNMHLNVGEYDALTRLMPAVLVAAQTDFADSVAVDNYKGRPASASRHSWTGHGLWGSSTRSTTGTWTGARATWGPATWSRTTPG